MTKLVRQGLGLVAIGVVLFLLSIAGLEAGNLVRAAGFLFVIGGLIACAVGLFRGDRVS